MFDPTGRKTRIAASLCASGRTGGRRRNTLTEAKQRAVILDYIRNVLHRDPSQFLASYFHSQDEKIATLQYIEVEGKEYVLRQVYAGFYPGDDHFHLPTPYKSSNVLEILKNVSRKA